MDGLARVGQPEREQVAGHQLAGQPHRHVAEVDLSLRSGLVRLRNEGFHHASSGLDPDLLTPVSDVSTDHLVRDLVRTVLVEKPLEDPLHCVPLLAQRIQVGPQHLVDQRLVGLSYRRSRYWLTRPVRVSRAPRQRSADASGRRAAASLPPPEDFSAHSRRRARISADCRVHSPSACATALQEATRERAARIRSSSRESSCARASSASQRDQHIPHRHLRRLLAPPGEGAAGGLGAHRPPRHGPLERGPGGGRHGLACRVGLVRVLNSVSPHAAPG